MTEYKHTAADATSLAARCAEHAANGTGIALNAANTDLVAKALTTFAQKPIAVAEQLPPLDTPVWGFWMQNGELRWWVFERNWVDYDDGAGWCWSMLENQDETVCYEDYPITHWLPTFDEDAVKAFIDGGVQND